MFIVTFICLQRMSDESRTWFQFVQLCVMMKNTLTCNDTFLNVRFVRSVVKLKEYIEKTCKISTEKQVLLINGGLCLDPEKTVCSYSAGTDTNPIFLFSKSVIEATQPPVVSMDQSCDFGGEIKRNVRLERVYSLLFLQIAEEKLSNTANYQPLTKQS